MKQLKREQSRRRTGEIKYITLDHSRWPDKLKRQRRRDKSIIIRWLTLELINRVA